MHCKSCGFGGDILSLLTAIEGDFKRGLTRAQEMAGGAVGKTYEPEPARTRLPVDVYHELAERILEAGRLDGRQCVRDVEEYLQRRRLLELARADGWACLPGLGWLLDIARGVCEEMGVGRGNTRYPTPTDPSRRGSEAPEQSGAFAFSPSALLVAADLARCNDRGELVPTWGRWRLVIPWRGPDGRIGCLQRRRTWDYEGEGPEPAKYVFPFWRPDWPYGSEMVGKENGRIQEGSGGASSVRGVGCDKVQASRSADNKRDKELCCSAVVVPHEARPKIAIAEGAVDVLAMRALHPSFLALGIPGITSWREEWAGLVGDSWRLCLDRGKPRKSDGLVSEDMAAARIALSVVGSGQESADVIEWWVSRWRRGRALGCVLCGAAEPWLCGACGRRRAKAKDWGEEWAAKTRS